MHSKKYFISAVMFLLSAVAVHADDIGASWLRTQTANSLNPNLSVIADLVGRSGTANQSEDGLAVREVELGLQAAVDPYARADFFIGGLNDKGGSPELEEGFITLLSLPGGFQARGGKFRATFGRLNLTHPHEYPQVDAPFVLESFLGEEGLNSTGLEISHIFAPLGIFTEVTYGILHDLGATDNLGNPTTTILDVNGNPVKVAVQRDEISTPQHLRSFAHTSKVRFYTDLTANSNLDFGFSGALHEPEARDQSRLGAVDLTFRWKPLQQGTYRSFIWRSEGMYTDRSLRETLDPVTGAVADPQAKVHAKGAYSYVEYQPAQRWRAGVRGDYSEDPTVRSSNTPRITRALSPYVTFTLTEFNRFRIQYQRKSLASFNADGKRENENLGFIQWTVILGPHGAHPF